MDRAVRPLREQLRLNTDLLLNCVSDLTDEEARSRPTPNTNSISFLVAHVADARHFLAGYVGSPIDNPLKSLEGINAIDDLKEPLPSLAELVTAWREISVHLETCLQGLGAAELDVPSKIEFPVLDTTVLGGITFLLQHDAYHLGQIALMRKELGRGAMSYDRPGLPARTADAPDAKEKA